MVTFSYSTCCHLGVELYKSKSQRGRELRSKDLVDLNVCYQSRSCKWGIWVRGPGNFGCWNTPNFEGTCYSKISCTFMLHEVCKLLSGLLSLPSYSGARLKEWPLSEKHLVMVELSESDLSSAFVLLHGNAYLISTSNLLSKASLRRSLLIKQRSLAKMVKYIIYLWGESGSVDNIINHRWSLSTIPSSLRKQYLDNSVNQHVSRDGLHPWNVDLEST